MTAGTGWCQEVRNDLEFWLKCSMFDFWCRLRIRCLSRCRSTDSEIYLLYPYTYADMVLYVLLEEHSSTRVWHAVVWADCFHGVNKCTVVHIYPTFSPSHVGPASCCRYSTNLASDINGIRGNLRSGDANAQIVRCCRKFGIPEKKGHNLRLPEKEYNRIILICLA